MLKKFITGFTLVEVVITIAIIIILTTISVPIYKGEVQKAREVEGTLLLARIRDAQISYYNEYRMFLKDIYASAGEVRHSCRDEVLGIDARSNKYYTMFNVGEQNVTKPEYRFVAIIYGGGNVSNSRRLVYDITESSK